MNHEAKTFNGLMYLLNQVDGGLQIHTKVNKLPLDAFLLVFLLLQHKHVVVKELLEALIGVVDAQLFKGVELKERSSHFNLLYIYLYILVLSQDGNYKAICQTGHSCEVCQIQTFLL